MQVFRSIEEYVSYITADEIVPDEVFCYSYIPSAFFPKDVIQYFFERKDVTPSHRRLAILLWNYGRRFLNELARGRIRIAIEHAALRRFIESGVVHKAKPNFEATVTTRLAVLDLILGAIDNIYIIPEPAPYIFRLTPPNRVVIDVDNNLTAQTIQGLAFHDSPSFIAFSEEFERLAVASRHAFPIPAFTAAIIRARDSLSRGGVVTL